MSFSLHHQFLALIVTVSVVFNGYNTMFTFIYTTYDGASTANLTLTLAYDLLISQISLDRSLS